jgi:hypothetical protein
MGDLIFGPIVILIYGWIVARLVRNFRTKGTLCTSCKVCPAAKHIDAKGRVDLLRLAAEALEEEKRGYPKTD